MAGKIQSPYSASITGGGYLQDEFDRLLPLMQSDDAAALLKAEVTNNNLLQINSLNTRERAVSEFKKRFASCGKDFWEYYQESSDVEHRILYFFVLLRTYRILFDLHLQVTVKRFQASDTTMSTEALRQAFDEIAANDEFVDSWSEQTRKKVCSTYQTILRKVGFFDGDSDTLHAVSLNVNDYRYFLDNGEGWFLEACLLLQYEIKNMRGMRS